MGKQRRMGENRGGRSRITKAHQNQTMRGRKMLFWERKMQEELDVIEEKL